MKSYKITCVVEHITPTIAKKYIAMNYNNPRKINFHHVNELAVDMKAGKWLMNAEPIVFDANGDLKDGQHRLYAVIKADTPIDCLVVRGVDPDITTFDYGMKRSVRQELQCSTDIASVANIIIRFYTRFQGCPVATVRDYITDHIEQLNLAVHCCQIGREAGKGKYLAKKRDIVLAVYAMLRLGMADVEELKDFIRVVNTGYPDETRNSTAAITLARYINDSRNGFGNCSAEKTLVNVEVVIKSFGDFRRGIGRTVQYRIKTPKRAEALIESLLILDGLKHTDRNETEEDVKC